MAYYGDPFDVVCNIKHKLRVLNRFMLFGELLPDESPRNNEFLPLPSNRDDEDEPEPSTSTGRYADRRRRYAEPVADDTNDDDSDYDWDSTFDIIGSEVEKTYERITRSGRGLDGRSLLSCLMESCTIPTYIPFVEYSKHDGTYKFRTDTRLFKVFLKMVPIPEQTNPVEVCIVSSAKVSDLIGLACLKYTARNCGNTGNLKSNVNYYGVYIADSKGEIDWEFPSLDRTVRIGKFYMRYLALMELSQARLPEAATKGKVITYPEDIKGQKAMKRKRARQCAAKFVAGVKIMAILVKEVFCVEMFWRRRRKIKVMVKISLDNLVIEADPDERESRLASMRLDLPYEFDSREIVACEILKKKSHNRMVLRLINRSEDLNDRIFYETKFFEGKAAVAQKLVAKMNGIMDIRESFHRKKYLEFMKKKGRRPVKKNQVPHLPHC